MSIKRYLRRFIAMAITVGSLTISGILHGETLSIDTLTAQFTFCGERRRENCVVDGDTFWFHRQKIRIADIDAPELSPPRCAYEREKGEAARRRSGVYSIS